MQGCFGTVGGIQLRKGLLLTLFMAMVLIMLVACSDTNNKVEEEEQEEVEKLDPESFAEAFRKGDYEQVYGQLSESFQKEVSVKELKSLGDDFHKDISTYVLQSKMPYGDDAVQYVWTDDSGTKGLIAVFDEEKIVQGLQIMPLEIYPDTDEVYTKTKFNMPFEHNWFVFWGGINPLVNYHYEYENQRYAYDFVKMEEQSTYEGDPMMNENYYAFGEKYIAPADGTVVKVENDIKDNEPVGKMNDKEPLGNYVIIDHGNDEFSYLAHFKYDSIEVKEGDEVKQGDLLGLVGNSGNSSEPHIHFHVADSSDPNTSKSIRISFEQDKEIKQGDFVEK